MRPTVYVISRVAHGVAGLREAFDAHGIAGPWLTWLGDLLRCSIARRSPTRKC